MKRRDQHRSRGPEYSTSRFPVNGLFGLRLSLDRADCVSWASPRAEHDNSLATDETRLILIDKDLLYCEICENFRYLLQGIPSWIFKPNIGSLGGNRDVPGDGDKCPAPAATRKGPGLSGPGAGPHPRQTYVTRAKIGGDAGRGLSLTDVVGEGVQETLAWPSAVARPPLASRRPVAPRLGLILQFFTDASDAPRL